MFTAIYNGGAKCRTNMVKTPQVFTEKKTQSQNPT